METKKRDHALDFLKIIATVAIFLHHYELGFDTHFRVSFGFGRFYYGWASELFFIISGFLAYSGIEKIRNGLSFDRYFFQKYRRIAPLAAISTFAYSVMYLVVWKNKEFSLFRVLLTAFCVQYGGAFSESFLNSHLWYLSVLLICHAFFFIIVRSGQRLKIDWRYGCFFMIVLGTSVYQAFWQLPFLNTLSTRGYMAFFTGVLLASVIREHKPDLKALVISLCIITATVLILVFDYDVMEYGLIYILIFIFFPALVVLFETEPLQKVLDRKILGTMAGIAFNVYIWHFEFNTFCSIVNVLLKLEVNFSSRLTELAVLLLDAAIGTFSYYLIERPIAKLIKRKLPENRPGACPSDC